VRKPRSDCNLCHGKGTIFYQKCGEPAPKKKGQHPPERPCPCAQRERVPLVGKKGRRMVGIPTVEYIGRNRLPKRERRKEEK